MTKNFTSILAGFCLALLISAPAMPFPQQNTVVKHRGGGGSGSFVHGTQVAQTNSTPIASITSPPLTVTAGDLVYVECKENTATSTASSSPSATWTASTNVGSATIGTIQGFWSFGMAGGSTTFTCTPSISVGFQAMIVREYHPGFLTVHDTDVGQLGSAFNSTPTSATITTSAKGLVIGCWAQDSASTTESLGTIAGTTATNFQTSDGNGSTGTTGCQDLFTSTSIAGTSVTNLSASQNWVTQVTAFK